MAARPFPANWETILARRVPLAAELPVELGTKLRARIQVFLAEKRFIGCAGLTITDDIRVTVAGHACLLLINRPRGYYPKLDEVLIYPSAYFAKAADVDEVGIVTERRDVRAGESWEQGQVVLSWEDAIDDARYSDDGCNVIIHEFAHQFDEASGHANGMPALDDRAWASRWGHVFSTAYEHLLRNVSDDEVIDEYGAESPAEFFAVTCEAFFERGRALRDQHPDLYRELSLYFELDPATWR